MFSSTSCDVMLTFVPRPKYHEVGYQEFKLDHIYIAHHILKIQSKMLYIS